MSPLTKALVLLVTVLSIVLVALVIPFVAQTDDLNAQITALNTKVSVTEAAAAKAGREKAELESQLAQAGTDQSQTLATLRSANATLQKEKASLEANLKEANAQVAKDITTLSLMSATQDQLTKLLEDRNAIVSQAQAENVRLKSEAAQLIQRNDDLDAQVTALSNNSRILNEKIVDLQEQLAGKPILSDAGGAGPIAGPQIRGSVTGIQQVDDIVLISLNVGSNDSVSANTQFVIFRDGDQFVGTATIKSVDETVSVGKIDSAKEQIQVGDSVMTGINF